MQFTNLWVNLFHDVSQKIRIHELAKPLDKYPNFSVDMAARIVHFKVKRYNKVRDFIIKYPDRLLYGTDIGIEDRDVSETVLLKIQNVVSDTWRDD